MNGLPFRQLLIVLGALMAASPAFGQKPDPAPQYRLGAGDNIVVTVFGHEDLSGEFELDGEGRIGLPLIGGLVLRGRTLGEAQALIEQRLRPDYLVNPRVSVQVSNYRPFYILGEVNRPGSYPYVNGLTVVQAVAIAGGYTYRARESRVMIRRAGDEAARQRGAGPATVVLPGDIVTVPQRYF